MIKVKINKSTDGQWYATIHSKNGQTIFTSETYTRKVNCWNGIMVVVGLLGTGKYEIIDNS